MPPSKLVDEIGQFTVIPNWIIRLGGQIGPDGLALILALRYHSGAVDSGSFPSYDTLQSETGLTRRRIAKAIRNLESMTLLERKKRFGQSTIYTIKTRISTDAGLMSDHSVVQGVDYSSTDAGLSVVQGVHTNKSHFNKNQLTRFSADAEKKSPEDEFAPKLEQSRKPRTREQHRQAVLDALAKGLERENEVQTELRNCFHVNPNWDSKSWKALLSFLKLRPADETVQAFSSWWKKNDWRGKQGQAPTPAQIYELWPQAFVSSSPSARKTGRNGETQEEILSGYTAIHKRTPTPDEAREICSRYGVIYEPTMAG